MLRLSPGRALSSGSSASSASSMPGLDEVALGHVQALENAVVRSADRMLHLHRLEHEQHVPLPDRGARRGDQAAHAARHRRREAAGVVLRRGREAPSAAELEFGDGALAPDPDPIAGRAAATRNRRPSTTISRRPPVPGGTASACRRAPRVRRSKPHRGRAAPRARAPCGCPPAGASSSAGPPGGVGAPGIRALPFPVRAPAPTPPPPERARRRSTPRPAASGPAASRGGSCPTRSVE